MSIVDPLNIAPAPTRKRPRRMTPKQVERYELGRKVWEARIAGFSFDDITSQLNKNRTANPLAAAAVYQACQFYMERVDRQSMTEMKWLVIDRLEKIQQSLSRKMTAPGTRAEEVAIKAMERLCALLGLDYADQQNAPSSQPITINISAHPGDPEAQRIIRDIASGGGALDREPAALPPPAQGVPLLEADNGAVWGDGFGEDVLRTPVGLEEPGRPEDGNP